MIDRFKRVGCAAFTQVSMLVLVCCLCVNVFVLKVAGEWNDVAVVAVLLGAVDLLVWLVWATIVLATNRAVKTLPPKVNATIDWVSLLLYIGWGIAVIF